MTKYRVSYVERILREVVIDAKNDQAAEDQAHQQQEAAEHHHAVDVRNDDWQVEANKASPRFNGYCLECGTPRV